MIDIAYHNTVYSIFIRYHMNINVPTIEFPF